MIEPLFSLEDSFNILILEADIVPEVIVLVRETESRDRLVLTSLN